LLNQRDLYLSKIGVDIYKVLFTACVAELAATICRGCGQVQICSENTKVKRIRSQDQDKT